MAETTRMRSLALLLALLVLASAIPQVRASLRATGYVARLLPGSPLAGLPGESLVREWVTFEHQGQELRGLVVRPGEGSHPGMVLVLGLEPDPDEPGLTRTLDATARLGFAVLVPYVGTIGLAREDPGDALYALLHSGAGGDPAGALVQAFDLLRHQPYVKDGRAGFMGFSVGASLAAIAASDPRIRENVAFLHWFGGYFSARDVVVALLTGHFEVGGSVRPWNPVPWATERVRRALIDAAAESTEEREALEELLAHDSRSDLLVTLGPAAVQGYRLASSTSPSAARSLLDTFPGGLADTLDRLSPETHVSGIRAPTFVLHDTGDTFVPPIESQRFWSRLAPEARGDYTEVALFDHVTIRGPRDAGGVFTDMTRLIAHLTAFLLAVD